MRYALPLGVVLALIASAAAAAPAPQPAGAPALTIHDCMSALSTCLRHPIMRVVTAAFCSRPCSNVKPVQIPEDIKPFVGPTLN